MMQRLAMLAALVVLAGCGGSYRPGTDSTRPILMQNLPSNGEPQPAGSRPR